MNDMKDSYKYLIAKNDTAERKWLPLWVHCVDTFHVMDYLLSHWLIGGSLHAITKTINPSQIRIIALFLSIFHDFGKASITFQAKIAEGVDELHKMHEEVNLCTPSVNDPELRDGKKMPHGVAGEILLLIKGCPASLAAIVGAHHGRPWEKGPDIAVEIEDILEDDEDDIYRNFIYGLRLWGGKARRGEWIKAQDNFYNWALEEIGIVSVHELPSIGDSEAVILSGLVIMADWIASNEAYFPLITYNQKAPDDMKERAVLAMEKIELPPTWRPAGYEDICALSKDRFGFYPNVIQEKVIEAVLDSAEPGLFILEAPMGIGKTEAALLAAEEFTEDRTSGVLFALPTQATANSIFSRIIEWGKGQAEQNTLSIRLAHGMANLNEEYLALMDNGKHADCIVDDYENNRLIVHDFFQGSKQALLADFVVSTVDQILLASLKQKHFMLRHLGLCGKVVIIDECHAYDAYMNEYLERTLQWLGAYRTPVIMLSATLPYKQRSAFIDAYMRNKKSSNDETWRKAMGYPLLTWTDGREVYQEKIAYSGIKRDVIIETIYRSDMILEQAPKIIRIIEESLHDGGCVAVVLNTVKRAQLLALEIKKALPDKHMILLHSRFISEDRIEYEKELLSCAGKQSEKADRDGLIVIGTQVIEQSLDFDVDLMITDLCPMDLLLQRIGRLHRHAIHDDIRPDVLKHPKCYVLGEGDNPNSERKSVYDRLLLMRTKGFLPTKISLPNDIPNLVQNVYDYTCQLMEEPEGYLKAFDENIRKKTKSCNDADAFRLFPPGKERTINRFIESAALADEEQAKAQVRNSDVTIETIVLFNTKKGLSRAPWRYRDNFNIAFCPSTDECRAIANQRVRFPSWVTGVISKEDLAMPSEWEKSVWLRGRNLLILDEYGLVEIGDYVIKYDRSLGLSVERRQ